MLAKCRCNSTRTSNWILKDSIKETVENKISVEVISMVDYGRMNADKVLTFAIDLMK